MFGRHRHASVTPFKWRSARGPVMARLYTLFPLINLNKEKKSKFDPLWQNFLDPRMDTLSSALSTKAQQHKQNIKATSITLYTSCLLGIFSCLFCRLLIFQNHIFQKIFQESSTIRVSNSLDPDQAPRFVGTDLSPNCFHRLQVGTR